MTKLSKPGSYLAKISGYGIYEGKKGDMPAIIFEFMNHEGNSEKITWFGSMNGEAPKYTIATLVRCGFKSDDPADVQHGMGSGVLDEAKEFEIVIENQPNPSKNGEMSSRVKWVNTPGGSQFRTKMDAGKPVSFAGMNLAALCAEERMKAGVAKVAATPSQPGFQDFNEADLPF